MFLINLFIAITFGAGMGNTLGAWLYHKQPMSLVTFFLLLAGWITFVVVHVA